MTFSEFGLDPQIMQAIEDSGYTTPTPIQEQAIPYVLQGRDVLGIAQTGTGKTASFSLPMIQILAHGRARARMPRSLILCPTRELAAQVAENFENYGKHYKLTMALLIGGVNFKPQEQLIDRGVDVLIATPGRLLDHFERGKLMLTGIQILVVDEADRMLDMGFIPDIEKIVGLTPFTRQTLFFSATMPPEITRLTQTFLSNPVRVEVARQATVAETVKQRAVEVKPAKRETADREKRAALCALIDAEGAAFRNAIVFCNRKRDIGTVCRALQRHGLNAGALHGDLDQSVRTATLNSFRDGGIGVLVASDVAARGLDIPNVSHVVNYDVPTHAEDYVHRIGRTGRAGREGRSITLVMPADGKYLDAIEKMLGNPLPRAETPADAPAATGDDAGPEPRTRRRAEPKRRAEAPRPAPAEAADETHEKAARTADRKPKPNSDAHDKSRDTRGRERASGDRKPHHGGRDAVVGMGDHTPAFLLRPVRLTREPEAEEADAA